MSLALNVHERSFYCAALVLEFFSGRHVACSKFYFSSFFCQMVNVVLFKRNVFLLDITAAFRYKDECFCSNSFCYLRRTMFAEPKLFFLHD